VSTARRRTIDAFTRAAPTYNAVGPPLFSHFARKLVEFAEIRTAGAVLDVATGTGAVLLEVAEHFEGQPRLVGVDATDAMLHRAATAAHGLADLELHVMDAEQLDLEDDAFDLVFCAFALSSFPDRERAIAEFRRVLKPRGRLCTSDSFGWYFDQDERWLWQRELLASFGSSINAARADRAQFTAGELVELLASVGFHDIATREESYELLFRDEDEWWDWSWSHGTRILFEAVPHGRRDQFRRNALAQARRLKRDQEPLRATVRATLTRADRTAGL
jgi:ubiquinone/menaquinone biosynthesis C-methylase UbiE